MSLRNCYRCKGKVSTNADECPHCGLGLPLDDLRHEGQKIRDEKRKQESAKEYSKALKDFDTRSLEEYFSSYGHICEECGEFSYLKDIFENPCPHCGNPIKFTCGEQGCDKKATQMIRIDGVWSFICGHGGHADNTFHVCYFCRGYTRERHLGWSKTTRAGTWSCHNNDSLCRIEKWASE